MKALIAEYVVKRGKQLWDNSGLITKIFILWAFGPALLTYMSGDFKNDFKKEILAEAQQNMVHHINPLVVSRDAQINTLSNGIADLKLELSNTKTEIKADIRELRTTVINRLPRP